MGKYEHNTEHYGVQFHVKSGEYVVIEEQTKAYVTFYNELENAIAACNTFNEIRTEKIAANRANKRKAKRAE